MMRGMEDNASSRRRAMSKIEATVVECAVAEAVGFRAEVRLRTK